MPANCKRSIEITVPAAEVEQETERVVQSIRDRAKLPGFRPGKAPVSMIRSRFAGELREQVVRALVPKHFQKAAEDQNLHVVGTPDVTDVRFQPGEPLAFKAEFEVWPDFELKEYRGLSVPYREPQVTDEQVAGRLEELRVQKAEFINEPARPAADGDFAVTALEALGDVDESLRRQDEIMIEIGGPGTLDDFSRNLRGLSPGEDKEFDVVYPEDYGDGKLAGRTLRFRARLSGIRRRELPELNDAFAADLGDFKDFEELREELRKSMLREQEYLAQQAAKDKLVEQLAALHDFPVPEALLDQQIRTQVEQYLRSLAARGVDLDKVKLDWNKVRESQQERATREVRASLVLGRIAEREAVEVTQQEVDHEIQRLARAEKVPAATLRKRLEDDGGLNRLAGRLRTAKTLNFLFEHARKIAEE